MNLRISKRVAITLASATCLALPAAVHAADNAKVGCSADTSSADCPHNEKGGGSVPGGQPTSNQPINQTSTTTDPFNCKNVPQNCQPGAPTKPSVPTAGGNAGPGDPRAKATARAAALRMRQQCEAKYRNDAQQLKACLSRFAV